MNQLWPQLRHKKALRICAPLSSVRLGHRRYESVIIDIVELKILALTVVYNKEADMGAVSHEPTIQYKVQRSGPSRTSKYGPVTRALVVIKMMNSDYISQGIVSLRD